MKDDELDLQVNVRVTAPSADFPDRQLMTGVAVLSAGHSLVVEVRDPYTVVTSGCPSTISPCLNDGGVRIVVDKREATERLARREGFHSTAVP